MWLLVKSFLVVGKALYYKAFECRMQNNLYTGKFLIDTYFALRKSLFFTQNSPFQNLKVAI
jgi:hypothetical protein